MKLLFRRAIEQDIDMMEKLDRLCFTVPWSRLAFLEEVVNNDLAFYLVALMDAQIVGYAGLWRILDEGHITNVAVHPDYRRKGIGERLLKNLLIESEKSGLHGFTLEVRPSNNAAIALYSKFGFKVMGRREKYYKDNQEDALIMWKL